MGEDEDGHEEVLTLGRMHTRGQARVNRYYTAAENEEVEDDGGNCNDNCLTICYGKSNRPNRLSGIDRHVVAESV
jgi:hypothetical protein